MSIIWFDGMIELDENYKFQMKGGLIFMTINFLSVICSIVFFDSYRKNVLMQKAPYNLLFFKIIFEGILSLNLFIIFFSSEIFESFDNFFIKFNSTFSPALLFLSCYLNGCLAHNIYLTYYDYRKSYEKRIKIYRISALILSGFIYMVTLVNLDFNNFYDNNKLPDKFYDELQENEKSKKFDEINKSNNFTFVQSENNLLNNNIVFLKISKNFACFNQKFIIIFYFVGILILFYISHHLYYIVNKDHDYISFIQDDPRDSSIKILVRELVKRNIFLLSYTLISFIPNNIIFFLKFMLDFDLLNNLPIINFITIISISFNACYSFIIIVSDPYMKKFFKPYYDIFKILKGKKSDNQINKLSDLVELLGKSDINDLNKNFIPLKINDYNYSNIYVKFETQEMNNLDSKEEQNNDQIEINSLINLNNHSAKDVNSPENFKLDVKNQILAYQIKIEGNDINLTNLQSSGSLNELNTFSNNNSNNKVSQFLIAKQKMELSNKKDFDNNSEFSFHKKRDNSIGMVSMDSYDSSNLLLNKKSSFQASAFRGANQYIPREFRNEKRLQSIQVMDSKSNLNLSDYINSYDYLNTHLEFSENICRMIAISISLDEDREFECNIKYLSKLASSLPWVEKYYTHVTDFKDYSQKSLPDWMNIKNDPRFKTIKVKICKYMPLVYHHIRIIDKISIDKLMEGLDPLRNFENMRNSKIIGGRSENPIIYTWNKNFVLKTISKQEKNIMEKMLKEYQMRLRDTKTLICRIYGLYKIKVGNQYDSYVILMRNMCELPLETRYFTFDLKGSSVDRSSFKESQRAFYDDGFKDEMNEEHKNLILKDNDFKYLKINFYLSAKDAKNLILSVENDSQFLSKYNITDYSLLVTIHKFEKEDYMKNFNCRVMKSYDDKYLYNFAIIDFLTIYDIEKFGEKITKDFSNIVSGVKDMNISVQNAVIYRDRFKSYLKNQILSGEN